MKKQEAKLLAPEKSKIVIEWLQQLLSCEEKFEGRMNFDWYKIDGNNCIICDINVPDLGVKRTINLEITKDHSDILYEQLFDDLIDTFLEHETMGISRYRSIRSSLVGMNFDGMDAFNRLKSVIEINFICIGPNFRELATNYNQKIDTRIEEIKNRQVENETSNKSK